MRCETFARHIEAATLMDFDSASLTHRLHLDPRKATFAFSVYLECYRISKSRCEAGVGRVSVRQKEK